MSDIRIKMAKDLRDMSDMVGDLHWMAAKAVEDLIRLRGEIAKRDETIARLEPQLNRAIQANYDLREELTACRVAVENCELFRARIVELESKYQRDVHGLNNEGDPIGGDPAGGYANDNARMRALFAAIKAKDTVGEVVGWYRLDRPYEMTSYPSVCATWHKLGAPVAPLYAAPVSEAKAQGVVQWPDADEIMQMAFEEGQPADDASGYCFELEEFDLFIERLMSEVARLNAATAAPAADAGGVLEQAMYTLISIGYHENSGLVHELRQALAAARQEGGKV